MDASVNPPEPMIKPITIPPHLIVEQINAMSINIIVDNIIIATPAVSEERDILAIRGNFVIGLDSCPSKSI